MCFEEGRRQCLGKGLLLFEVKSQTRLAEPIRRKVEECKTWAEEKNTLHQTR